MASEAKHRARDLLVLVRFGSCTGSIATIAFMAQRSSDGRHAGDSLVAKAIAGRPPAPIVEAIVSHDDRRLVNAATRAVDASLSLTSGAAVSTSWSTLLIRPGAFYQGR